MKERRINREERKRKKEKEKEKRRASANKRRRGPFGSCRAALLGSRRGLLKLDTVDSRRFERSQRRGVDPQTRNHTQIVILIPTAFTSQG